MSFCAIWGGDRTVTLCTGHAQLQPHAGTTGIPLPYPATHAHGTHVLHGQPHGLDGFHIVDLAALTELGRQHTLLGGERLSSAGLCTPTRDGAQPTLLDVAQCTRGTTT